MRQWQARHASLEGGNHNRAGGAHSVRRAGHLVACQTTGMNNIGLYGNTRPHVYQSISHTLGSLLPQKTKAKIWANQYGSMHEILYPDYRPGSSAKGQGDAGQFLHTMGGEGLTPTSYRRLGDINLWQKAMEILGAVITEKDSSHAPDIFLYMANIKKL